MNTFQGLNVNMSAQFSTKKSVTNDYFLSQPTIKAKQLTARHVSFQPDY